LQDLNVLNQVDPQLAAWIVRNGRLIEADQDLCLIAEGDPFAGLLVLEQGTLIISTSQDQPDDVELACLGAGSMVGEMSWLESRPAMARVVASAGSRIRQIEPATLARLQRSGDAIAPLLYRAICTKLSLQIQSQNAWIHRFTASAQEPLRKVLLLFAELEEQDVAWLGQLGHLQRLPPGGVLLEQGQPVPALYLVLAGDARIQINSGGQLTEVGSSRRGELLGEMSLLNPAMEGASARVDTLDGMELLRIDREALLAALAADSARATRFWRALARMLSQRSRDQLLDRGLAQVSRQAEETSDADEMDLEQLSAATTAGLRFDWLCRRFQDQGG
jgi:bacteriocin-type transport-associated protein